ncbi:2Fe-2S iron-sulfur cluster-binding protein [Streptomyces sp. NPDC046203]|uniref:(2Fe-2S)-binding protein n=1 Tax=Streptomyces sp. NPDC046203 TaxID=3154602 RepID=UPI0033EB2E90
MSDAHKDDNRTSGWEPVPQSEGYDGDATAFVQLPPEFMLEGTPLEAPGHGYVPPMITPLTPLAPHTPTTPLTPFTTGDPAADPATGPVAAGSWEVQPPVVAEQTPYEFHESWAQQQHQQQHPPAAGPGPVTYAGASDTLPGGALAPWAEHVQEYAQEQHVQEQHVQEHVGEYAPEYVPEYAPEFAPEPVHAPGPGPEPELMPEPEPEPGPMSEQVPVPEPVAPVAEFVPEPAAEPVPEHEPEAEAEAVAAPAPGVAFVPEQARPPVTDTPAAPVEPAVPAQPLVLAEPAAVVEPALAEPVMDEFAVDELAVPAAPPMGNDEHPHTSYVLRVNGADRPVTDAWIGESLLYVLRERLGLAGAKDGCSQGECGACNVQVDGRLVASCLVPAATAAGSEVRTVEGLAAGGEPSDVQRALASCGVQCGFCIPGMAMTVHDLLEGNHAPTELETRQALSGNLCRCSGYRGVLEAVREVVEARAADPDPQAGAGGATGDEAARIPHQIPHPYDGGTA